MKCAALTVLALLLALFTTCSRTVAEDELAGPHRMTTPDGELDTEMCPICHEEDLSLTRSHIETCTLCHGESPHTGVAEHLHAPAAAVTRLLGA